MKNRKKNCETMIDAVAYFNDGAIADCMMKPIPTVTRRASAWRMSVKVIAAVAACAVFMVTASVMLVMPFMRSDQPSLPAVSDTDPEINDVTQNVPNFSSLSYHPASVVELAALAEDKTTLTGEGGGSFDASYLNRLFFRENMLLAFDFEDGETVTVTSQKGGINPMIYPEEYYEVADASHAQQLNWIKTYCNMFSWNEENCVESHTLTNDDAFLMWNTTEAETYGEDILTFVIRNAEGQITGAGSVLMVKYHPITDSENYFYDKASLVRWAVLGSVRFDHPADVTEEAVAAFLDDMNAKAEEAKAALSFDVAGGQEKYVMALADAMNASYTPEQAAQMGGIAMQTSEVCSFYKLEIENLDHSERHFLLFKDGTWKELKPESFWVQTSGVAGLAADFHVYFTDGTSVRLDEEEKSQASGVQHYTYLLDSFFPPQKLPPEKVSDYNFWAAYKEIMEFLFIDNHVRGPFSGKMTPYDETLNFREYVIDTTAGQFKFMVFYDGTWGMIEHDTGYADEAAMTGREITFSNGVSFVLEWQEVERGDQIFTALAPTFKTSNP